MKKLALLILAAVSLVATASAHPINIGVDNAAGNSLVKPNGSPLQSGEFKLRVGYFNFDTNYALNNAAILANAGNQAALEGAWVNYFTFDAAQQAQGDTGAFGDVNGVVDPAGVMYAYLEQENTTYNGGSASGGFIGKNIYIWIQLNSAPSTQLIASDNASLFPVQNDPFNAAASLTLVEGASPEIVVGNDRTATSFNDYQLVSAVTAPSLAFDPTTATVSEIDGTVTLTVTRSGLMTGTVTVNYTTTPGTAVAGTDYTTTANSLSFGPNVTSLPITVPILNRPGFQATRAFTVVLSGQSAGDITADTATVTITDNAQPVGTVQFSAATYNVNENGGPAVLSVTRTGGTYGPVSATISTANVSATAGAGTPDYTALSAFAVNFPDGDAAAKTVNVTITDDAVFEGNETFTATLTGTTLGAQTGTTVTIVENDAAPPIGSLSLANAGVFSVAENAGTATVTVNRSAGSAGDTSVTYTVTPGTALETTDYNGTLTGTLSWIGADTTAKTFQVGIVNNTVDAPDKTFEVTLSAPTNGAVVTGTNPGTVTIVDEDVAGELSWSSATPSVAENAGTVTLTVNRAGGPTVNASVTYTVTPLTAQEGIDYTGTFTGTLSWVGSDATSKSFSLGIVNNTVDAADKTFQVTLSSPTNGAVVTGTNPATVTIADEDVAGAFSWSSPTASVAENAGTVTLTINRTGGSSGTASVTVNTSGGSPGTDYTPVINEVLAFANGQTSRTVTVTIANDAVFTGNRTFDVILSDPTNAATLGVPATTTVTITEDEIPKPGTLNMANPQLTATETAGSVDFVVYRSKGLDGPVSVTYTLVSGTATAGLDYTGTTGVINFAANENQKTTSIPIINDTLVEPNEKFGIILSSPTNGATLGLKKKTIVTIVSDDLPTKFTVSPATLSVAEGSPATINVIRTSELDKTFVVNYSTAAGSAAAGEDFTPVSGTLTFGPNVTSLPVTIATINDTTPESPETFTFNLKLPNLTQTITLGTPSSATITFDRNDSIDRPDNQVAVKGGTFVGNNVYNGTGDGQIASKSTGGSSTATFVLRVGNDGNLLDSYLVRAVSSGTATGASVRYYRTGTEITGQITGVDGYIVSSLAPGSTTDIEVQVQFSGSKRFTGYGATLTTSSIGTPASTDTARVMGIVQ